MAKSGFSGKVIILFDSTYSGVSPLSPGKEIKKRGIPHYPYNHIYCYILDSNNKINYNFFLNIWKSGFILIFTFKKNWLIPDFREMK